MKVESAHIGTIGLIQQQIDGSIKQIELNKEQSELLQIFLSSLSKGSKLLLLPKEYDLKLNVE